MVAKNPPRGTKLVVSAIRNLRDVQGTTSRDIMNFISSEYDVSDPSLKRHVQMALRRGMSYGIIQRAKGGYYLTNPKSMVTSSDALVDACCRRRRKSSCKKRRRRSGCKKRRRRSKCKKRRKRSKCRKRKRRSCRRRKKRCGSKKRKRCGKKRRRSGCKKRCRGGDDEMDEMAGMPGMNRIETRKMNRSGRSKFSERSGSRRKTPGDGSSARGSSSGRMPLENAKNLLT